MKKRLFTLVAMASVAFLALTGCSNKIDTAKIRDAMQTIEPEQKAQLEVALTAIDAGKYNDALMPLRKVSFGAKLDKDQAKLVNDTMAKLRAKIAKGE